ncbi:MAG: lipid IV(A) 3-deoxy-D-manno-octulosonic acid transferase [Woeseiaceae bacterium]|nr:lipid IV(A) 3-deoxy-D-manno-octulosonic acid transferase [Woeseiaceae bacterium]
MQFIYNLLTWILLLPFSAYWVFRGVVNRSYWDNLSQRFGFGFPKIERCVWLHAVSVGEVQAAVPLIRNLMQQFPERDILVTTVTPTGAARVRALFGDTVKHCYIPFEIPTAVRNFYRSVNPEIALIMETEIWPNLYRGSGIRGIPLILVSARISPRSVPGYRRLLPLFRETLSHGIIIAAQSRADADRFLSLGANAERTRVTGNIKFDIELEDDLAERGAELRAGLLGDRPVWIAASTHNGEEKLVLNAHRKLLETHEDLLLLLVPRHPERFLQVRELVEKSDLTVVARTDNRPCEAGTQVFLGDTMGELPLFYAASDIAFVAGSLIPIGGHNLLEPAALSKPIISGPHVFNGQEIADMFVDQDACRIVRDWSELADAVEQFLDDTGRADAMGRNGFRLVEQNRGSMHRLLVLLEPLLGQVAR